MQPFLVPFTLSLDKLSNLSAVAEIIKTNEKSLEYGLNPNPKRRNSARRNSPYRFKRKRSNRSWKCDHRKNH